MKITTIFIVGIWVLIVGGNIVQAQVLPSQAFMDVPKLPWLIVFMPIIIVVAPLLRRRRPFGAVFEHIVDGLFGQRAYRQFMDELRLELLFSTMCMGIVMSALVRTLLFGESVFPPQILGFFASGSVAFLAAYFIRRARDAAV